MSWGKSDQDRIEKTLNYVAKVSKLNHQVLVDFVNGSSIFSAESISKALSLGFSRFSRGGTSESQRHAIRGCMLARIVAESPASLGATSSWKNSYKTMSEASLKIEIAKYLARLSPPVAVPVPQSKSVNVNPSSYGVTLESIQAAKGGLKRPTAKTASTSAVAPGPPPGSSADTATKKTYFEKVSRCHVVLSGHGSWPQPWPKVTLKPQQKLCCYIAHYYPLGNDVGQLIDSRRFPVAVDEYPGGTEVCDYTLHHKDSLRLMNHSVGDAQFITVNKNTPISTFINDPKYATATFHFAACRVVFCTAGDLWCPVHNAWEPYVQGGTTPCVLR